MYICIYVHMYIYIPYMSYFIYFRMVVLACRLAMTVTMTSMVGVLASLLISSPVPPLGDGQERVRVWASEFGMSFPFGCKFQCGTKSTLS